MTISGDNSNNSRVSKFFKDLGIYSIGVVGTRIITFMMVPLYTYFIEKADYGYYDICLTLCMMLIPVSTLQLREGAFRFLYSNESDSGRIDIVSFIYRTVCYNIVLILAIALAINMFYDVAYLWHSALLLVMMTIHDIVAQTTRGLHNNKVYVASSIVNVLFVGLLSVVFVAWMRLGVAGIFYANIIARVATIVFIESCIHSVSRYFHVLRNTKGVSKDILRYTIPLIPISVCFYLTTCSDRLFVNNYLGFATGGVYAVAVRFTSILQTLSLIFYQSWQETAISQYDSDDKNAFFSKVFNMYFFVLVALLIVYTFALKVNYGWLVEVNYAESLYYIYPMGVAAIFNALSSSYFELLYQCAKDTKRATNAIFLALVINLSLNFLLISHLGVWGVILTSLTTYLFLDIYRYFDTRRYFSLSVSPSLIVPALLIALCAVPFYLNSHIIVDLLVVIAAIAILFVAMPRSYTQHIVQGISRKFKKK